jgi:hypothetical protein
MGRTILGILAGMVAAWVVIMACQFGSAALYPPPPGLDLRQPDQLAAFIADAPATAMALVVASWVLGAFIGGWVAARIARAHPTFAALAIGLLVVVGVVANTAMIPHPLWMTVLGLVLPLPAAWLASRSARPRTPATT